MTETFSESYRLSPVVLVGTLGGTDMKAIKNLIEDVKAYFAVRRLCKLMGIKHSELPF